MEPMVASGGAYRIRPLQPEEFGLVEEFLYEAIFVPPGVAAPSREVVANDPTLRAYYEAFGSAKGDCAWCAEAAGDGIVGLAWCRRMAAGFGLVDGETPELAMAVRASHRGRGIGTRLLGALLEDLRRAGYSSVSLSVQKANFALRMYGKAGFRVVREAVDEVVMVKSLDVGTRKRRFNR